MKQEKRYFSAYQTMCIQGRTWDYANRIGLTDDEVKAHSKELSKIVHDNQKDGNADMGTCEQALCAKFDEILKQRKKRIVRVK